MWLVLQTVVLNFIWLNTLYTSCRLYFSHIFLIFCPIFFLHFFNNFFLLLLLGFHCQRISKLHHKWRILHFYSSTILGNGEQRVRRCFPIFLAVPAYLPHIYRLIHSFPVTVTVRRPYNCNNGFIASIGLHLVVFVPSGDTCKR